MNECDHDPEERCARCRPTRVADGRAALDDFKKKHGIKSDDLARSLMAIEEFAPQPKDIP